jgi:hypothetical protein
MILSEWADLHRSDLVAEPPDKNLIAELRAVADREIRDAETVESCDGRLGHAHTACLAIATAATFAKPTRVARVQPKPPTIAYPRLGGMFSAGILPARGGEKQFRLEGLIPRRDPRSGGGLPWQRQETRIAWRSR